VSIKFTRAPDGTFVESGDLPVGTRTVLVYIDGVRPAASAPRQAKDHVKMIRELVQMSPQHMPGQVYELRELDITPPAILASRTAQLIKARKAKKDEGEAL